jgi:hypothetical protein
MSTSTERIASRNTVVWMGNLLIAALGLIHLLEAPEELEEATYLGLLFLANFGGAVVAAIGIYLNRGWGWLLGATLAGASFVGYVLSCTVSLPGLEVEEWLQPLGMLALLVEVLFVGLWLTSSVRRAKGASLG